MQPVAAILCERIQPPSGVRAANVLGISDAIRLTSGRLPGVAAFGFYFVVLVEGGDVGKRVQFVVDLIDPDGEPISEIATYDLELPMPRVAGRENPIVIADNARVEFDMVGPHEVRLLADGRVLASRSLYVRTRDG